MLSIIAASHMTITKTPIRSTTPAKTRGGRSAATDATPPRPALDDAVKSFFAREGRRGGRSKSDRKIETALENIEKACEARWGKSYRGRIAKKKRRPR